eukprot:TRINITY_DN36262_c0_g1_i1.p1 TRINITY_DN36262_c0_g1~~TRINITY_DN36262_c0_g1_i1.p1  ORF type:complete len:724 (+),score=177.24 TRINITY_DN36262_c0_g1_i1:856-3027(+)
MAMTPASQALFGLRLQHSSDEVRQVYRALIPRIAGSDAVPSAREFGNALYGLRGQPASREVRRLLLLIAERGEQSDLDAWAVASGLYGLQLQSDTLELRRLLDVTAAAVSRSAPSLGAQQTANALYGLQGVGSCPSARRLLTALRDCVAGDQPLSAQGVAASLFGLRRQTAAEGVAVVAALVPRASACEERLTSTHVATSLFGVNGLGPAPAVLEMLGILTDQIGGSMTHAGFSTALFGLQSQPVSKVTRRLLTAIAAVRTEGVVEAESVGRALHGFSRQADTREARLVLRAVAPMIYSCSAPHSQALATALQGINQLRDTDESREVLEALASFGDSCADLFSAGSVAIALLGLREQPDTPAVRRVLQTIGGLIDSREPLAPREVAVALHGLKGQRSTAESDMVLARLTPAVLACGTMQGARINMAVFGLHGFSDSGDLRKILSFLFAELERASHPLDRVAASGTLMGLASLAEGGVDVSRGFRAALRRLPSYRTLQVGGAIPLQALHMVGVSDVWRHQPGSGAEGTSNAVERAVRLLLMRAGVPGLRFNFLHETGFECDVYQERGRLNIELDGSALGYRSEGKLRAKRVRDRVLAAVGVTILRLDVPALTLAELLQRMQEACEAAGGSTSVTAKAWSRARALANEDWATTLAGMRSGGRFSAPVGRHALKDDLPALTPGRPTPAGALQSAGPLPELDTVRVEKTGFARTLNHIPKGMQLPVW